MKYCIQYYKNFRYNDLIDEVVFIYTSNIVEEIQKQEWTDTQRIIIDICEVNITKDNIMPILMKCNQIHSISARISFAQEELREQLREAGIPYFYATYANTADEVYALIRKGASDVYITESLAFNITKIGTYCKKKGVAVRIIPNVAQYKIRFKEEIPDPYKFFVRPEDTELYEDYADVFEIIAPQENLSVIYEIYRNKQWMGDLGKLIAGFSEPFLNSTLVPYFGPERLKCGQRCMQEQCNLCQQMKELASKFADNNLVIKREKDKKWKNESKSYKEAVQSLEKTASESSTEVSEG